MGKKRGTTNGAMANEQERRAKNTEQRGRVNGEKREGQARPTEKEEREEERETMKQLWNGYVVAFGHPPLSTFIALPSLSTHRSKQ